MADRKRVFRDDLSQAISDALASELTDSTLTTQGAARFVADAAIAVFRGLMNEYHGSSLGLRSYLEAELKNV